MCRHTARGRRAGSRRGFGVLARLVLATLGVTGIARGLPTVRAANPPAVTGVSPSIGWASGGTAVTITGTNFVSGATAAFAGNAATGVSVVDSSHITATAPAGSGPADVTVTTTDGTSATSAADRFTYAPLPAATGISPTLAFSSVATAVTITGSGFAPAGASATVTIGGQAAANVAIVDDGHITATAPTLSAGTQADVQVSIILSGQTNSTTLSKALSYVPSPSVSGVVPTSGPESGGTSVTITGTGFAPGGGATASVKFGTAAASDVTVNSATQITASSPSVAPGTGTVDVTVTLTLPGGTAATSATNSNDTFTFIAAPEVDSVGPASGSSLGGTDVTITGKHFQFGAVVLFGPADGLTPSCDTNTPPQCNQFTGDNQASPYSVNSATSILATTPAGVPGATNVVVINPDGQYGVLKAGAAGHYRYTGNDPAFASSNAVTPNSGSSLGGTSVTIGGTNFEPNATVTFGGNRATGVTVNGAGTSITLSTPAHAAGAVDITVINPDGGTATLSAGYTYTAAPAPTINSGGVSPSSGSSLGGTTVTIAGTNFASGASVSFGGTRALVAVVLSPSSIQVSTPARSAGTVEVTVTNADGQSVTATGAFTYNAAPAPSITSGGISPSTGSAQGGTVVTISGANFAQGLAVSFGGVAGTKVTVSSDGSSVSVTTPAHAAGAVNVVVTNPDGQAATAAGGFTYSAANAPAITAVGPCGNTLGNTTVTIDGANFASGALIFFSGKRAVSTSFNSATQLAAVTPAGVYGQADVSVTNPDGQTATLAFGCSFTTAPPPSITSITPNSGPGGTQITITGSGFAFNTTKYLDGTTNPSGSANSTTNATVTVGGQPLQPLPPSNGHQVPVLVNATTITGIVPTLSGSVDVAVINPDHQGAVAQGGFTYPSDMVAPTTATAVTGTAGSNGWYTSNVSVALTATDNNGGSGVKQITYSATGAQTVPQTTQPGGSASLAFSAQGTTTLSYFATDNAGNVESANTLALKIDRTPPAVSTSAAIVSVNDGSTLGSYTAGQLTNQNVAVTFSCSDSGSGVATLTGTSSGSFSTSGTNPLTVTVTSAGSGQTASATCTDTAGNTTTATFSNIVITRTAPVITAAATSGGRSYSAGSWTNQAVTVTFTCTPDSTANQIVSLTNPVQVAGPATNQTVSGSCTDAAGNSASTTFGTASAGIDIDLTLPIASATAKTADGKSYTAGAWTNQNVTITFSCTDAGANQSGVASVDPPVTVTAEGSTRGIAGGCSDNAGNLANPKAFFGPILIDKTPPSCAVSANPNPIGPSNGKLVTVTAGISVTDQSGLSGGNGFQLVSATSNNLATAGSDIQGWSTGTADTSGQLRATKGRGYTLTYTAFDTAGNTSATCSVTVSSR